MDRAVKRHATRIEMVFNGRQWEIAFHSGPQSRPSADVMTADGGAEKTGESLPESPTARAKVLFVPPTYGEASEERVWFRGAL